MPGRGSAPRAGKALQQKVVELAKSLGLKAETEVTAARRIWGSKRHIDVVLTQAQTRKKLGIECKAQAEGGTAEEKVFATIQDIESWPIPGIVVIEEESYSDSVKGCLISTGKVVLFDDLEDWLRLFF